MSILLNKTYFQPYAPLIQLLGFQGVWFAWALGMAQQLWWPGLLASVLFLLAHRLWQAQARRDRQAVCLSVLAGFGLDTLLMACGLLTFAVPNPGPLAHLQPWWMGLLWACLGCTLHHALAWLKGRPLLAAGLSAVSGALSYEAAARMGALTLPQPPLAWVGLAVFWAVFIPWVQRTGEDRGSPSLG
jgi:hypothetical protein